MAVDSIETHKKMFSFSLFAVVTELLCYCREASHLAPVGVCWRRLKVKEYKCVFLFGIFVKIRVIQKETINCCIK